MSTFCEFPNCCHTSDDTKVNRLRIHENLAKKWDQVFRENLEDRIGNYLYICRAHFDSNTKKLILPKPTAVAEIEEITFIKTETAAKDVPRTKKQKASMEAHQEENHWFNSDNEDEPLLKRKETPKIEPLMPEQMFFEEEHDVVHELLPEIKEEVYEPVERQRSPIKQGADWSSMVPETMKPSVLLSSNLGKVRRSSNLERDKKKYEKMRKELQKVKTELDLVKMRNEVMQKDMVMTKNRINFIEANFGGAASKRNNPFLLQENE